MKPSRQKFKTLMLTNAITYKIIDQLQIFDFILETDTRLINMTIAVVAIKLNIKIAPLPKTNELLFNNSNPS